ncbi:MAG: YhbY family RNA-binding protein [Thermosphaera sp.]
MDEEVRGEDFRERLKERRRGKVDIRIGKKGVTESLLEEVRRRLEKQGVVKVKVLKSARAEPGFNREEFAEEVARAVGGVLKEVKGYTFIIVKKDR